MFLVVRVVVKKRGDGEQKKAAREGSPFFIWLRSNFLLHHLNSAGGAVGVGDDLDGHTVNTLHLLTSHVEVAYVSNGLAIYELVNSIPLSDLDGLGSLIADELAVLLSGSGNNVGYICLGASIYIVVAILSGLNQVAINVNQNGTVTFYVERYPVVVLLNDSDHGSSGLLKNFVSIGILSRNSITNIVYTVGGYSQLNSVAVLTGSGVDGSSPGSGTSSPVPVNLGLSTINGNNNLSVGIVAGVADGSYVLVEDNASGTNEVLGSRSSSLVDVGNVGLVNLVLGVIFQVNAIGSVEPSLHT